MLSENADFSRVLESPNAAAEPAAWMARYASLYHDRGLIDVQCVIQIERELRAHPVESYNQAFIAGGAWLVPQGILTARFAKVTAQFDF